MPLKSDGPLVGLSSNLREIVARQGEGVRTLAKTIAMEKVAPEGASDILELAVELAKLHAAIHAPGLVGAVDAGVKRLASQIAAVTKSYRRLILFCEHQKLDPRSNVRLVKSEYPFARAQHHTEWRGTLIEAYPGNLFSTSIEDRQHFVIYMPGVRHQKLSSPALTIRDIAYR